MFIDHPTDGNAKKHLKPTRKILGRSEYQNIGQTLEFTAEFYGLWWI
jgi:hypothetical protein